MISLGAGMRGAWKRKTKEAGQFRHLVRKTECSFAVTTLLHWYQQGIDPQERLLSLSTFLGHVNPSSTAVYLTITADLRNEASQRFERFAAPLVKEVTS